MFARFVNKENYPIWAEEKSVYPIWCDFLFGLFFFEYANKRIVAVNGERNKQTTVVFNTLKQQ